MPIQARTEFAAALNQLASEKGVEVQVVIDAIQQAALAAYRKDLSLRGESIPEDFDELIARINPSTGEITIHRGEENITPPGFARIAAQTAKQVIAQRLHEAEKGAILDEYSKKIGTVVSGTVQRQEGNTYFIDLGRAEGVLPPSEQVRGEVYIQNQRLKFFIKEIKEEGKNPNVILSRSDSGLIVGLFAMEVPEIQAGTVEIKAIAREAGARTKVAAVSLQEGVDPVGSLVGQKGVRVQAVINEIGEEKIDIIAFSEDPARFIAAALSPAKDVVVELDEKEKTAKVKIAENQLSLAIGKGGQNVRLAAKLTLWKIDIEGLQSEASGQKEEPSQAAEEPETAKEPEESTEPSEPKEAEVAAEDTGEKTEENTGEVAAGEKAAVEVTEEPGAEEEAQQEAENDQADSKNL